MTRPREIAIEELEAQGAILAIQDGNHGEKHPKATDYVESGIPFIMASDIANGRVDLMSCKFLCKSQADSLRIGFAKPGDVLLTHKGSIGNVAIVPPLDHYLMLTPQVTYYRVKPTHINNRYLKYAFLEPGFQSRLALFSAQSTRPYIGITAQRKMKILFHPLSIQRRIVSILSAYDDMIENNLRRIKILEEMAQSLYREWFVKFRFPGHERVRMVYSSMGKIPAAWSIVPLAQVANVNMRSIRQLDGPKRIRYVDISSVSPGRIEKIEEMDFIDAPSRARRVVRHGDTIWSSVRPNRRSFALVLNPPPNLIVSTGFAILSPTFVPYTFLYQAVTTEGFVGYLTNHATGAAYPAVSAEDFETAEILLPPTALLDRFQSIVENIETTTHNLKCKIPILRETRDLLLPKLISGEVDVSELGIVVPEEAEA